jgi:hypothetical protein
VKERVTTRPRSAVRVGAGAAALAQAALAVPGGLVCAADVHRDVAQVSRRGAGHDRRREAYADAVAENRSVDEVARAHRVSWPTVQRAVDARAAERLGELAPTRIAAATATRPGRTGGCCCAAGNACLTRQEISRATRKPPVAVRVPSGRGSGGPGRDEQPQAAVGGDGSHRAGVSGGPITATP